MEPGSLPIGRLAPRSWSNLLGGSRGHTWLYSNQQLRGAARVLPERRLDGRPHPRGRGPPRSDARRVPRRPSEGLPDEEPRSRRHCSAAPFRRVPRLRGPEAYPTGSRPLYVCPTRARERAHIVVPDTIRDLHELRLPLIDACIAAQQAWSAVTSTASPRTAVPNKVVCRANASAAAAMWNSRHHRRTRKTCRRACVNLGGIDAPALEVVDCRVVTQIRRRLRRRSGSGHRAGQGCRGRGRSARWFSGRRVGPGSGHRATARRRRGRW
jgi:hypothetical protein